MQGFRKVEHARWSFANDDFVRGREEDLLKIRRRTAAKTKNEGNANLARGAVRAFFPPDARKDVSLARKFQARAIFINLFLRRDPLAFPGSPAAPVRARSGDDALVVPTRNARLAAAGGCRGPAQHIGATSGEKKKKGYHPFS